MIKFVAQMRAKSEHDDSFLADAHGKELIVKGLDGEEITRFKARERWTFSELSEIAGSLYDKGLTKFGADVFFDGQWAGSTEI